MNNSKKLPLVDDLKSISFDFENGKITVNDFDIGHCTEISISCLSGTWRIAIGYYDESVTLVKKIKSNN